MHLKSREDVCLQYLYLWKAKGLCLPGLQLFFSAILRPKVGSHTPRSTHNDIWNKKADKEALSGWFAVLKGWCSELQRSSLKGCNKRHGWDVSEGNGQCLMGHRQNIIDHWTIMCSHVSLIVWATVNQNHKLPSRLVIGTIINMSNYYILYWFFMLKMYMMYLYLHMWGFFFVNQQLWWYNDMNSRGWKNEVLLIIDTIIMFSEIKRFIVLHMGTFLKKHTGINMVLDYSISGIKWSSILLFMVLFSAIKYSISKFANKQAYYL